MSLKIDQNNNSLLYQSTLEAYPPELIQHIFSYLEDSELGKCRQVCKQWQALGSDEAFLKKRYSEPEEAFGKKKWETYIGKIEEVPHLPREIKKILESPCPIWGKEGKKIKDTHILFYNPQQVNGQSHTVNNIEKLVKSSKEGNATVYRYIFCMIANEYGDTPNEKGEWILMTKDVLPGSRNKTYDKQQSLVKDLSKKAQVEYLVPKLTEAITGIFAEFVRSGTCLYSNNPWTYTRCQEQIVGNPLVVGGFAPGGLFICSLSRFGSGNCGVGALRKF